MSTIRPTTPMQAVKTIATLTSILCLSACAHFTNTRAGDVDLASIQSADVLNLSIQDNNVFASGQPTQDQLQILANAGVQHVISLRTAAELEWNEAQSVQSAGMQFHNIPLSGRSDITVANADLLDKLLKNLEGQPVLVHCGSSNRVAALVTLSTRESGASADEALEIGRDWGLTKLEPAMRAMLESDQSSGSTPN